jgi:hypothetical protein
MKSYPPLRQDLFAWCLTVVLPVIWAVLVFIFPLFAPLVIYMVVVLAWVLHLILRKDLCAWCLAVVLPAIWVVLIFSFSPIAASVIYLVVALAWILQDRTILNKQGITPPSFIWFWFPVVYLYQRDRMQSRPWQLMLVCLLCTILSFVTIYLFSQ